MSRLELVKKDSFLEKLASNHVIAQGAFLYQAGQLFTTKYPGGWTVNESNVGNYSRDYVDFSKHGVTFTAPSTDNSSISIKWLPVGTNNPGTDKDAWYRSLSEVGVIDSIDNRTKVDNQPALTAVLEHDSVTQMFVVTFLPVPTSDNFLYEFQFSYGSSNKWFFI